jgi:hypothetical protein
MCVQDLQTLLRSTIYVLTFSLFAIPAAGQMSECLVLSQAELSRAETYLRIGVAGTATKTTPFTINVETEGMLFVKLIRKSITIQAPVRLRVFASRSSQGPRRLECDTQWLPLGQAILSRSFAVNAQPDNVFWHIEIFDQAEGGPTGDPPHAVEFQVRTNIAYAGNRFAQEAPAAYMAHACSVVSVPPRPGSVQDLAVSIPLEDQVGRDPIVRFFDAGRNVYLKFDQNARKRASIMLSGCADCLQRGHVAA